MVPTTDAAAAEEYWGILPGEGVASLGHQRLNLNHIVTTSSRRLAVELGQS